MNIIWLTPEFPSNSSNTKGIYIFRTVKELSKHFDLYVICLYPASPPLIEMLKYWKDWKKIYSDWKKNYLETKPEFEDFENNKIIYLKYYRLPRGKFHNIEGWFAYFQAKKYLSKIVDKNTIIHANWIFPAGTMAQIISKKYNIPFLISLMGSDVNRLVEGTRFWKSAKNLLQKANIVTAVTNDLFEKCAEKKITLNDAKTLQIDNIYESDKFIIKNKSDCKKILNIDHNKKVVFFAGGLIPVKNVDVLIEAFYIVFKKNNNLNLYLAGKGTEEGNLKRLVKNKGIQNNVIFVGSLLSDKLIHYYNAADLFCLPSKSEGLPNVIVESLFCGTPAVASNVGGIPSIIKNGINGLLVEPNSSFDLANKLEEGLQTNWDQKRIRESILHLSPQNVLKKYKMLYEEIQTNG